MSKARPIVIINGSGGVGKDTFVDFINENHSVLNVSSVDIIKHMAKLAKWEGGKEEKDRKFLSDLKILCTEYNDLPFKYCLDKIETFTFMISWDIMFIHIREPKEIQKLVDFCDKIKIHINTLLITNINKEVIISNMADKNIMEYNYDYYIENNGTLEELKNKAEEFYNKVKL